MSFKVDHEKVLIGFLCFLWGILNIQNILRIICSLLRCANPLGIENTSWRSLNKSKNIKMAQEDGTKVQVYVYDLSRGMARAMSLPLLGKQIDAIYHTSVVINRQEHFFGHGINIAPAGTTPFGLPIEVLDIGYTQLPEDVRDELLVDLADRYTPEAYNLIHNNCNNFTEEYVSLLTGNSIPNHITGLPQEVLQTSFGQTVLQPMLAALEQQLVGFRRHAGHTLHHPSTATGELSAGEFVCEEGAVNTDVGGVAVMDGASIEKLSLEDANDDKEGQKGTNDASSSHDDKILKPDSGDGGK